MTKNLWNTQSPTKRTDFYFKIDDYKKHLLCLKNVRSTFDFQSNSPLSSKHQDLSRSAILQKRANKGHHQLGSIGVKLSQIRERTFENFTERHSSKGQNKQSIKSSRMQIAGSNHSKKDSPKKITNYRQWQIRENNKKIWKRLQKVKASRELSKENLSHKYQIQDLKYKTNLQRTKYANMDYTKAAWKLIKGEKINFKQVRMSYSEAKEKLQLKKQMRKSKFKIEQMNLKWEKSKTNIPKNQNPHPKLTKQLR